MVYDTTSLTNALEDSVSECEMPVRQDMDHPETVPPHFRETRPSRESGADSSPDIQSDDDDDDVESLATVPPHFRKTYSTASTATTVREERDQREQLNRDKSHAFNTWGPKGQMVVVEKAVTVQSGRSEYALDLDRNFMGGQGGSSTPPAGRKSHFAKRSELRLPPRASREPYNGASDPHYVDEYDWP